MEAVSKLEQIRRSYGWSRAKVEQMTGGRISEPSLERWEKGLAFPREDSVAELCKLFSDTRERLGLIRDTMAVTVSHFSGETTVSDIIRREVFSSFGSRLTSLVDAWGKRNYCYVELQGEINKAVLSYNSVVEASPHHEQTRRQAIKDMILAPVQLVGGLALIEAGKTQKTDTDLLLKRVAAGIAGCWYLRRGKELSFVSDVLSIYYPLLLPLLSSQSETYRKASAELLSQSFRLKGSIANALENCDHAIPYYQEAIRYGVVAESNIEQVLSNRMMAFSYRAQGVRGSEQALFHAEAAYKLMAKDTPSIIRSFTASGLSLCQAASGKTDDAKASLAEACDLFDVASVPSVLYTESNLLAIRANVYQYSGLWQESIDLWIKSLSTFDISTLGTIEARIQYTEAEVSRDDKTRDMDLCIKLLTEAITGARELESKRYIAEATSAYTLCRIAWPQENAVKQLGRDHFGG